MNIAPSAAADLSRAASADSNLIDENVFKKFGEGTSAVTALDNISFDVHPREFVTVIGPSGCGKSTLFSIIGGFLGDYDGNVRIDRERISGPHPAIGMVFQEE